MLGLVKKTVYPAGIDLNSDYLKLSQLGLREKGLYLNAAAIEARPEEIKFASADWQRWVVSTAKTMFSRGGFSGKGVIASIPSEDIFIDHIKVKCGPSDANLEKFVFSMITSKLPFKPSGAMINYVVAGNSDDGRETDVVVMAAEREIVNRQLAIYEKAGLEIKGISVWPLAMVNSYVKFFTKRQTDAENVAMLLNIDVNQSKIVITKKADLLFARMIPIGLKHLNCEQSAIKLIAEIEACGRYFEAFSRGQQVQRLVFFSGCSVDDDICGKVSKLAERLNVPAQIGDVLAAVEISSSCDVAVDRRGCQIDWAIAFGLSLTCLE